MGDVSKTIVVVLIIATILVSVIGTWTVLSTIDKELAKKFSVSKSYGQISVRVGPPLVSKAGGDVMVNVQKPPA